MRKRGGLNMIVDVHLHCGYSFGWFNYNNKLEDLIDLMDKLHIKFALNNNSRGLSYGDYEGEAREDIEIYEKTKGRIMSYFTYNPFTIEKCLDVIDRYYDNKVFKGIKIHPASHQIYAYDDDYDNVWKYASDNNIIILSHTWDISMTNPVQKYAFPLHFEKYLMKYPDVKFICGHSGGRYKGIKEAVKLAKKYKNFFLDTAGDIYANGFVEYLVNEVGSDRVLYGSDYTMMDQRNMLGIVLGADIKLEDKDNILFKNALDLFKIDIENGR